MDPVDADPSLSSYLYALAELSLMVLILLGNALTLAAIYTTPSLQGITYRYKSERTYLGYGKHANELLCHLK